MKVKEVFCKTALVKSKLPGVDYALNPYRGCQHACLYCYSPSVLREERPWGSFVDVKVNLPRVLSKELRNKEGGVVSISTVTDGYQPIERRYQLTRRCLLQLLKRDFPISVQTKSSLVLRDLEIIKKFSDRDVGFTITTIDDRARRGYEPFASPVEERLAALKEIAKNGIDTWVFIGPIMPYITDKGDDLKTLIRELSRANVKEVIVDKLRMKPGLNEKIKGFISKNYPGLVRHYGKINEDYFDDVRSRIFSLCKEQGLDCTRAW